MQDAISSEDEVFPRGRGDHEEELHGWYSDGPHRDTGRSGEDGAVLTIVRSKLHLCSEYIDHWRNAMN